MSIHRNARKQLALLTAMAALMGEKGAPYLEQLKQVKLPGHTSQSKYKPHQGKRERERREKRAARAKQ